MAGYSSPRAVPIRSSFVVLRDTPTGYKQWWSKKHGQWVSVGDIGVKPSRFRSALAAEEEVAYIKSIQQQPD